MSNKYFSNKSKTVTYEKFYPLKTRYKQTGFESISSLDTKFRSLYRHNHQMADDWDYPQLPYEVLPNDGESYIDNLKKSIKTIDDPMVFYSGGVDSELLLSCFIEENIPCRVVIFELKDLLGNNINQYDLDHAYEFCKKHSISPIIKSLCPETLWENEFFVQLAKDLKLSSPQITTHAYMVYVMSDEYPNYTYCLAGEIRYQHNPFNPEKTVLVNFAKIVPISSIYGATFYSWTNSLLVGPSNPNGQAVQIRQYWNTAGDWSMSVGGSPDYFQWTVGASTISTNNEDSGSWTNTPARNYTHNLSFSRVTPDSGSGSIYLRSSPWNWTIANSLNPGFHVVVQVNRVSPSAQRYISLVWSVTSVPGPATVSRTVQIQVEWTP